MYFVQGWMKEKMRIIAFLFACALVKEKKNKEKKKFLHFLGYNYTETEIP